MGQNTPLPGGRQPAELVRESTMKLKVAERDRLLALADEAERAAEAEAAHVAKVEADLEELVGKISATQQMLAEVSGEWAQRALREQKNFKRRHKKLCSDFREKSRKIWLRNISRSRIPP